MSRTNLAALAAAVAVTVLAARCGGGGGSPSGPTPGGGGGGGNPPPGPVTILAAGDIGECGFGAPDTGKILDKLSGLILALGDLAYQNGSATNFRNCYDPFWGRHIERTRPVPGNHEYENPERAATAYFDYFGDVAGPRGFGYYAFSAGDWRIIALNSEISFQPGSAQMFFLRNELQNNRQPCTLAYWHRPLFTSGPNLPQTDVKPLWTTLAEFDVDVVVNGHDHMYERFAPQDADGRASATGIREFIAGTGGAHLYTPGTPARNSEARGSAYGILALTLGSGSYQWQFVSVNNTYSDTGSWQCH